MYVVMKVRVQGGRIQSAYCHREKSEDEVVDAETDVLATDVEVVAELAVRQMSGWAK